MAWQFAGYSIARGFLVTAVAVAALTTVGAAEPVNIVELTQVPCQFLESENNINRGFATARRADCVAINNRTAAERLDDVPVLRLPPGKTVFRVTNRNVPYDVGFSLREEDYDWRNPIHKLTKIRVTGNGLKIGQSRDYTVELEPGRYIYSCPFNSTPNYRLVVSEP